MSLRLALVIGCASRLLAFGQAAGPIPGVPFSADQVTLHQQTHADGTITETRDSRRIFRDSSGRLRQDLTPRDAAAPGMEPLLLLINDPVASILYALEVPTQIAHRVVIPKPPDGQPMSFSYDIPFPANDGKFPKGRPDFKSESLGTQIMQGIEVQGQRTTTTWSRESQGSDKDLISVNEMWTSKALGIAVMIKRTDFRWGTDTQQLENIQREEPDASLFVVPPDYHIVDMALR